MYVKVDEVPEVPLVEGFQYTNCRGKVERLRLKAEGGESLCNGVIVLEEVGARHSFAFWQQDIPKVIKLLQAAQEHLGIAD